MKSANNTVSGVRGRRFGSRENIIPTIVVSGLRESKCRLSCLEAGAADFMAKPFHPTELDFRIQKQLEKAETPIVTLKPSFIGKMMRAAAAF